MSVIFQASTLTVSNTFSFAFDPLINSCYVITFNSTTVTLSEARAIAQAASLYLATGKANYTSPSGITVIGSNGSVSVAGTALTFDQLASFAQGLSHCIVTGARLMQVLSYDHTTT